MASAPASRRPATQPPRGRSTPPPRRAWWEIVPERSWPPRFLERAGTCLRAIHIGQDFGNRDVELGWNGVTDWDGAVERVCQRWILQHGDLMPTRFLLDLLGKAVAALGNHNGRWRFAGIRERDRIMCRIGDHHGRLRDIGQHLATTCLALQTPDPA